MGLTDNPPHPGGVIQEAIEGLGISVAEAARQLGVTRAALSRVVNGRAGISPTMALRLEAWLGGPAKGPSAETWLGMQSDYDLWQARHQRPARGVRAAA